MFEKNMKFSYLLDLYADVLDEHERTVMTSYYNDDLSLAEIAQGAGISRQGVRHVIKRAEEKLLFLEDKLGLSQLYLAIDSAAVALDQIAAEMQTSSPDGEAHYTERLRGIAARLRVKEVD